MCVSIAKLALASALRSDDEVASLERRAGRYRRLALRRQTIMMSRGLVALVIGYLLAPLVLGVLPNLAAFTPGTDAETLRAQSNFGVLRLTIPAQFVAAAFCYLFFPKATVARPFAAIGIGAAVGLLAGAVAHVYFVDVAHPGRLYAIQAWGGAGLGFVTVGMHAWLTKSKSTQPPDELSVLGLSTPTSFRFLGASRSQSPAFVVRATLVTVVGWVGACACTALVAFAPDSADLWQIAFLAGIGVASLYLPAYAGQIKLDQRGIEHRNAFGRFRMDWSEVHAVEVSQDRSAMVLIGVDKRLAALHPRLWTGAERNEARDFLAEILKSQALVPRVNRWAGMKINRNVRVLD